MTDADAKQACTHFLSQHRPVAPAATLRALAGHPAAELPADFYGDSGAVAVLETRVAELLGKPAGLFFVKGVTAQLAVLKAYAEASGRANVALHPMSHIDLDEGNAVERVTGLKPVRLGKYAPFGVEALEAVTEPLAAVVVELPLRRAGYLLPSLDQLRAISDWCRARSVPLHFDGARLWEAAAGYGIPIAELAALADSVYVSFYKGLGGLGGAVVAGPEATIRALGSWKTRLGGNLFTAYPYAIAGLAGLDRHLPRMPDYVARARALAALLTDVPGLIVNPREPYTNAFQLILKGTPAELAQRNRAFAAERKVWLFNAFSEAPLEGHSIAEIVMGEASDDYGLSEAVEWINAFVAS